MTDYSAEAVRLNLQRENKELLAGAVRLGERFRLCQAAALAARAYFTALANCWTENSGKVIVDGLNGPCAAVEADDLDALFEAWRDADLAYQAHEENLR